VNSKAPRLTLSLDEEGVVRVVDSSWDRMTLTPGELARLLTGLLKAFVGTSDGEEEVDVSLN
jgi:hypothetical protein